MKLSFIIPAYNEEHYIARCIDAITAAIGGPDHAAGKDAEYEIIVVDNNSTDGTAAVVGRYHHVTLLHEPRRGANRARETGFEASHGDLVAFLDSDTEISSAWIARVQGEFTLDPKLVCASGPFIFYDLPLAMRMFTRTFDCLSWLVYFVNRFILHITSAIQGGGAVVRASALRQIGGHNTDLKFYGDDADLAKRLNKIGKVVFSFRFSLRSSGRRIAKEGMLVMGLRYTLNYFWITFFNRPFTTQAVEVRFSDGHSGLPVAKNAEQDGHRRRMGLAAEAAIFAGALICFFLLAVTIAYFLKTW